MIAQKIFVAKLQKLDRKTLKFYNAKKAVGLRERRLPKNGLFMKEVASAEKRLFSYQDLFIKIRKQRQHKVTSGDSQANPFVLSHLRHLPCGKPTPTAVRIIAQKIFVAKLQKLDRKTLKFYNQRIKG